MQVYSHSVKQGNSRVGSKLLIDHLKGVHEKAIANFSSKVNFDTNSTSKLLDVVCWLHDLGKYTTYFQTYLITPDKVDHHLKSHSNLGAQTAFNYYQSDVKSALFAFYLIKMHHSNLHNIDLVLYPENKQYSELEASNFNKQKEALNKLNELKTFFSIEDEFISQTAPKSLFQLYRKELKKKTTIEDYFRVNYLFSLLIEADKLDASDTQLTTFKSIPENAVDIRFSQPKYPDQPLKKLNQNQLRNYVRSEVVKNLDSEGILNKRIFTLAAPTGIGKTMTSLDFVLKLRTKIEVEEGYKSQVIYGLPFINIIEQALSEYEKTVGNNLVMGHYQFADIFGEEVQQEQFDNDEEKAYNKKKMAWDTWQKDIVITSFVQFFETLIGNRNRLLKKFHHFANSIIILDEVQTLALEKLPLIAASLYYACKFLNARVLIMTATQPKLFELMERELNVQITEPEFIPHNLLKNDTAVFACFNRTRIIPLIQDKIDSDNFLELFQQYWNPNKNCLIVVNKVSRSIDIFQALQKEYGSEDNVELFYLSTNITPIQRQERIQEIKKKLSSKTCILVSTQVVEAGVDLDFDMGFRDVGPIDSIVQVAGRINRENKPEKTGAPLYIIDFGDCQKIYGLQTSIQAEKSLSQGEISEANYKQLVEAYFDNVSDGKRVDYSTSVEIFDAMINLQYAHPKSTNPKKKTVSDFKIIEKSQDGISVFIELPDDQIGMEAREAYEKLLHKEISKNDYDKNYKRAFNQRIIAVPQYLDLVEDLKKEPDSLLSENLYWIKSNDISYYYDSMTGFKRNSNEKLASISY